MKKINIVTYRNSIFGLILLNKIKELKIKVDSIVVIDKTITDHFIEFKRQINKIGLGNTILHSISIIYENLRTSRILKNKITYLDYNTFSKNIVFVSSPNSASSLSFLARHRPEITVLAHCGLVNVDFLKLSGQTINSHPGILPYYRGLDVIEWAIFENEISKLGSTLHEVDENIDSGTIIYTSRYKIKKNDTLSTIKNNIRNLCILLIIKYLLDNKARFLNNTKRYKLYSKIDFLKKLSLSTKLSKFKSLNV